MAYGKSSGEYDKVLYFDMYTKKDEEPHFKVNSKEGELEPATFVEGYVKALRIKDELGYENKPETNVYLHLVDGKELYIVRLKFFMIGRSVMNSLGSLLTFDVINARLTIRLYQTKIKTGDKAGEKVVRVWVGYGPEALNWVLSVDEQKALTKRVEVNNQWLTDTKKLDAKLKDMMQQVIAHLSGRVQIPGEDVQAQSRVPDAHNGVHYSDTAELDEKGLPADVPAMQQQKAVDKPKPSGDPGPTPPPEEEADDLPFIITILLAVGTLIPLMI
jgi:hypothetical protein